MKPDEETKSRHVAGETSRTEAKAIDAAAKADPDLRAELESQHRFDRALGALLGKDGRNEEAIDAVMAKISSRQRDHRIKEQPTAAGQASVADQGLQFGGIWRIAACLVISLVGGLAVGWNWPSVPTSSTGQPNSVGHSLTPSTQTNDTGRRARIPKPVQADPGVRLSRETELLRLIDSADAATIADIYQQISSEMRGAERLSAINLVIYRWAELDPAGALAFLVQRENASGDIKALFAAWARIDSGAAWTATRSVAPGRLRNVAEQQVLTWLSSSDPRKFIELASGDITSDGPAWRRAFESITAAGDDVNDFFVGLPESKRGSAIAGIADSLVARDPQVALDWASEIVDGDDRRSALVAVIGSIARTDRHAAGRALQSLPDRFPQIESRIVRQLAEDSDTPAALDWIRRYSDEDSRMTLYKDLGSTLAKTGDDQLFTLYDEMIETEGAEALWGDSWFQRTIWGSEGLDYQRAIEWVQQLPSEVRISRRAAMNGFVFSWAKHDMAGAIEYVSGVENNRVRNEMHTGIVHHMLSMNHPIEKAWEYASGIPESPQRGRSMANVLGYMARSEPAAAADRIDQLPSNNTVRRGAVGRIAGYWGAVAPLEAADWATSIDVPGHKGLAYENIAHAWSNNDSHRAANWIGSLDRGMERDRAVAGFVGSVARFEADSAFLWAETIDDPETRRRASMVAANAWRTQNPVGARGVIETSSLPVEERQRLLDALDRP